LIVVDQDTFGCVTACHSGPKLILSSGGDLVR
jgi:hypothetical protein